MQSNKNKYKLSYLQKLLIYDDFSKKCHIIFKKILLLYWKFLCYLVCVPRFKSINSSSLSRKKYDGNNFIPTPRKWLQGQNALMGIGLIELQTHWIANHFLNIAFYKLFYTFFYYLHACGTKFFVLKARVDFDVVWVGIQCYSIKGSLFLVLML